MWPTKHAICDVRGPCQIIRSTVKPVFCQFRRISCACESLRCLDIEIWRFSCGRRQTNPIALPLAHARGVKSVPQYGRTLLPLQLTHIEKSGMWTTKFQNRKSGTRTCVFIVRKHLTILPNFMATPMYNGTESMSVCGQTQVSKAALYFLEDSSSLKIYIYHHCDSKLRSMKFYNISRNLWDMG